MIGSGEAEPRAVVSAVRGVIAQARLDAGVNITGLLIDMGSADDADSRRHFMCWHLTRVLGPSVAEMVPPAVVRRVINTVSASSETILGRLTPRRPRDYWGARPEPKDQRGEERFSAV